MRILIANNNLGVVGGIETALTAVLPRLVAAGHDLAVLYEVPAPGPGRVTDLVPGVPAWPTGAVAAAVRWAPDIVYDHGLTDPVVAADLAARRPAVLYGHVYHGTCISGTKCHANRGHRTCTRPLGPGCLAAHLPYGCGGRNPLTTWRLYRRERRRQAVLSGYRAVAVASRHMAAEFLANGVSTDAVRVLPLFAPGSAADPAPPAPRPFSGRVLFIGRITKLKGWPQLAEAVPLAAAWLGRPLTLVVAGDGPDRAAFEAATRGQSAEFLGWVGADRRDAEMRAADVLAVPSVWPEPFGLVGIEAGGVGLPAAGFAVGGIPDWLIPGVSGESAPGDPPTAAGLAEALVRVLADADHWQRLRVGAWETARRFTVEAHLAKLVPILERAARGNVE